MAFKYEVVTAEEIEKMDLDAIGGAKNIIDKYKRARMIFGGYWCIDRERDAILLSMGSDGPEFTGDINCLCWRGEYIKFRSKIICVEKIYIEIRKSSFSYPESWKNKENRIQLESQVMDILKEALNVHFPTGITTSYPIVLD